MTATPNLQPTNDVPAPNDQPSAAPNLTSSQAQPDTQRVGAAGDPTCPPTKQHPTPIRLASAGNQATEGGQACGDTHTRAAALGPILADPVLGILADVVDDLEMVRIANENRLRTLTADGEHGHGLTLLNPEVARLAAIVDVMKGAEHDAILNLQRIVRKHPLGIWAKPMAGVGEKQLARLLSVIGDPYWNDLHDRPRTVSELWAFCGYHVIKTSGGQVMFDTQRQPAAGSNVHPGGPCAIDAQRDNAAGVAPKRARGQKSNWSEDARKRAFLIATSCVKQPKGTVYRDVYDETRAHYADAVHQSACVRCGPKGKPAQPGSPLSLGHQHARGLRKVAKTLLRDLWRESKRVHEAQFSQEIAA